MEQMQAMWIHGMGMANGGWHGLFAVFSGSLQYFIKRDFESFGGMKA
jgi:hypothetical protein